jgi:hypothetical protein
MKPQIGRDGKWQLNLYDRISRGWVDGTKTGGKTLLLGDET